MGPTTRKVAAGSSSPSTKLEHADAGEPLFNKDGSRRKSRVLRRKTDHSIIERRRREKINEKLVALQNIVPACRKECQDLFERKFATPVRATDDDEAPSGTATKRNAKRKREEEKLEKAKTEMSEKMRTNMVLEKLCIISHTLDLVVKLQEENRALRALCDCQAERRASINSDVELEDHYRSSHSYDALEEGLARRRDSETSSDREGKQPAWSPATSSDPGSVVGDEKDRPTKRRLHWGSDDVRETSIRHDTCRHKCCDRFHVEADRSLSPVDAETVCEAVSEAKCAVLPPLQESNHPLLPCRSISSDTRASASAIACSSFCRTRHSCCRDEEHEGSEASSEASNDLTSPPPLISLPPSCAAKWPAIAPSSHSGYLRRQQLPPIANLGLPKHDLAKHDLAHSSLRQDALASLYRRDVPRASEAGTSRAFRPLSLYTSHAPAPTVLGSKP